MKTGLTKLDIVSWCGFMIFATSGIVTPICLPEISRSMSINFSEGGGMETARSFLNLLAIVLAGLFATSYGKKRFIASGQYLLAAGLLIMSFAQSYPMLIAALMIIGIGGGFMEAVTNPLVVDIHPVNSGRYLNITNAFYSIGVAVSALLFGELLTLGYSWRSIFRIAAAGALLVGILFHGSRFPAAISDKIPARQIVRRTLLLPGFWLFAAAIFLGGGVESAFTFWSRSYVAEYLKELPRAGTAAVVVFAGTMAVGRLWVAKLSKKTSLRMIMMSSALLGVGISSLIPFAANLVWFYVLLALAGMAAACFWPSILAEAAVCLRVNPTILFVMLACAGMAGFGFTPWAMGFIGDRAGLRAGFFIIPCFFVILIAILAAEWRLSRSRRLS